MISVYFVLRSSCNTKFLMAHLPEGLPRRTPVRVMMVVYRTNLNLFEDPHTAVKAV